MMKSASYLRWVRAPIVITPRSVFILVLSFAVVFVNAKAQAEATKSRATVDSPQSVPHGRSIVKGRAVYEDTGQPAPRERVELVSSSYVLANRRSPFRIPTAITTEQGEFEFKSIPAGEYYVVARPADEHLSSGSSLPMPLASGDDAADAAKREQFKKDFKAITLDGANTIDLEIRVRNPHFGVVSGRVVTVDGEPAVNALVTLIARTDIDARSFGAYARTDEQGVYHLMGLSAGEYTVSASPPPKPRNGGETPRSSGGLPGATYFPSTIDPHNSPPVSVYSDRETSDINITLVARSLHSVTGTVRKESDGHPVAGAIVRLSRKDREDQAAGTGNRAGIEAAMSDYFSATDTQGRWSVSNLPDGTYTISVRPTAVVSADAENQKFVEKSQDLTVAGADVEDLVIEVSDGGRISGRVTVEAGKAIPTTVSISAGSASALVGADGTFTVTGVPEGEFSVNVLIWPQNIFYVKSIEVNGIDLLRENLKTSAGAEIKDIHIVISTAATLSGRVLSAQGGTPLSRMGVMLIPTDPTKRDAHNSMPFGVTNEQGNFVVSGAPGEYFVIVWRIGERAPTRDEDSLKKSLANALRVTLRPGERRSMDLVK